MSNELTASIETLLSVESLTAETVNKKKMWVITLAPAAAEALGEEALTLDTAGAKAFLAGAMATIAVGPRKAARKSSAPRKANPYREAIAATGRVEVPLDGMDAKKLRDAIFAAAYGLGLKGQFKVRKNEAGDALVGEKVAAA